MHSACEQSWFHTRLRTGGPNSRTWREAASRSPGATHGPTTGHRGKKWPISFDIVIAEPLPFSTQGQRTKDCPRPFHKRLLVRMFMFWLNSGTAQVSRWDGESYAKYGLDTPSAGSIVNIPLMSYNSSATFGLAGKALDPNVVGIRHRPAVTLL